MRTRIATTANVTETEVCRWIGRATPGDRLVYHRGVLCRDREASIPLLDGRERAELQRVARRAFSLAHNGLVHLAQHRHGPDDYAYIAIARPKPQSKRGLLPALLSAAPKQNI